MERVVCTRILEAEAFQVDSIARQCRVSRSDVLRWFIVLMLAEWHADQQGTMDRLLSLPPDRVGEPGQ